MSADTSFSCTILSKPPTFKALCLFLWLEVGISAQRQDGPNLFNCGPGSKVVTGLRNEDCQESAYEEDRGDH
jgi:hypothetical protein